MTAVRVNPAVTPPGLARSFKRFFGPCRVKFMLNVIWREGNQRGEGEGKGCALPAEVLAWHKRGITLLRKEKSSAVSGQCHRRAWRGMLVHAGSHARYLPLAKFPVPSRRRSPKPGITR